MQEQGGDQDESNIQSPPNDWIKNRTLHFVQPFLQRACVCVFSPKTKHPPTSQHSQKVENSGWRRGRRVRLQRTGSCCMWPHQLLLFSWTWKRTCSTCWCVDRNTPLTSDMSFRLGRLLQTVWKKELYFSCQTSNMCIQWVDLAGEALISCQVLMWKLMAEQWQCDRTDTAVRNG